MAFGPNLDDVVRVIELTGFEFFPVNEREEIAKVVEQEDTTDSEAMVRRLFRARFLGLVDAEDCRRPWKGFGSFLCSWWRCGLSVVGPKPLSWCPMHFPLRLLPRPIKAAGGD